MDWRMLSTAQTLDAPKASVAQLPTAVPALRTPTAKAKAPAGTAQKKRDSRAAELKQIADPALKNRFKRLSTQNKFVLFTLLGLALLQAVSTFTTSYAGIAGAAEWAFGVNPFLQGISPLAYDVAIVAFTIKLFMDREEGLEVKWDWVWIGVLATVSAAANLVHTLAVTTAVAPLQLIVGCIISAGSPFLLALTIDVAASKVFKRVDA